MLYCEAAELFAIVVVVRLYLGEARFKLLDADGLFSTAPNVRGRNQRRWRSQHCK